MSNPQTNREKQLFLQYFKRETNTTMPIIKKIYFDNWHKKPKLWKNRLVFYSFLLFIPFWICKAKISIFSISFTTKKKIIKMLFKQEKNYPCVCWKNITGKTCLPKFWSYGYSARTLRYSRGYTVTITVFSRLGTFRLKFVVVVPKLFGQFKRLNQMRTSKIQFSASNNQ